MQTTSGMATSLHSSLFRWLPPKSDVQKKLSTAGLALVICLMGHSISCLKCKALLVSILGGQCFWDAMVIRLLWTNSWQCVVCDRSQGKDLSVIILDEEQWSLLDKKIQNFQIRGSVLYKVLKYASGRGHDQELFVQLDLNKYYANWWFSIEHSDRILPTYHNCCRSMCKGHSTTMSVRYFIIWWKCRLTQHW